ncbi:site-specific integrase [Corallincola platygyrae]
MENLRSSNQTQITMRGQYKNVQIPVLTGVTNRTLCRQINLFILKKASEGKKDLLPTAKAMKSWTSWLQEKNLDPFKPTILKYESPTYGYRQYLLERISEENSLSSSTANNYILIIKSFYEMLEEEKIISTSDFFQYRKSIVDGYRKIKSSDLSIRVARKQIPSLCPLPKEKQENLLKIISADNAQTSTIIKLMMQCGLRVSEVLSIPYSLFNEDILDKNETSLIGGITIGPRYGVKTKFSKEREVFMTKSFLSEIVELKYSKTLLERLSKYKIKNNTKVPPLFITKNGTEMSKQAFYSSWYRLKVKYKSVFGEEFTYRPHDLRATFATELLTIAMQLEPNNLEACIEFVKYYMGHKDEKTTLKYIRFLNRQSLASSVAEIIDAIAGQEFVK